MLTEETVTILTPTYNRALFLIRLYNSLKKQTNKNFQWLIIDDGSNDETKDIVKYMQLSNVLKIDYVQKENGGKHSALNYSHDFILGRYLVIVDSDDLLVEDAVNQIIKSWEEFSLNENIAGITFQRGNIDNMEPFDDKFNQVRISSFATELNNGMKGDHCETVRADLFKDFRFPEFCNENFIAEGAMWYEVTKGKSIVFINKVIYLCEYIEGGLTKSGKKLQLNNISGSIWHAKIFLNKDFNLKVKSKNMLLYLTYNFISKNRFQEIWKSLNKERLLASLCWIPSYILHKIWKKKYL